MSLGAFPYSRFRKVGVEPEEEMEECWCWGKGGRTRGSFTVSPRTQGCLEEEAESQASSSFPAGKAFA